MWILKKLKSASLILHPITWEQRLQNHNLVLQHIFLVYMLFERFQTFENVQKPQIGSSM